MADQLGETVKLPIVGSGELKHAPPKSDITFRQQEVKLMGKGPDGKNIVKPYKAAKIEIKRNGWIVSMKPDDVTPDESVEVAVIVPDPKEEDGHRFTTVETINIPQDEFEGAAFMLKVIAEKPDITPENLIEKFEQFRADLESGEFTEALKQELGEEFAAFLNLKALSDLARGADSQNARKVLESVAKEKTELTS